MLRKLGEHIWFGLGIGIGLLLAYGALQLFLWLVNMLASGVHQPLPGLGGKQ